MPLGGALTENGVEFSSLSKTALCGVLAARQGYHTSLPKAIYIGVFPREARMTAGLPFTYGVYGLTLESDMRLSLPETSAGGDASKIAIVTRRADALQPEPVDLAFDAEQSAQQTFLADGSLYMCWRGWFDFLVSRDGRRVSYRSLNDRTLDFLEAYLTNYAVSAALLQQGEETLHATVVDIGPLAVGFLGPSGSGKSTLASFLRSKGGNVLTDDILRLAIDDETVFAHPGPHRLKLFNEPAARFLPGVAHAGRWSPVRDKLIYDLDEVPTLRCGGRLGALYHLRPPGPQDDRRVELARLTGLELFQTVSGSTMNNALQTPARLERHFRFVIRLARSLPVYGLTYPRTFDVFDEVAETIYRSALA